MPLSTTSQRTFRERQQEHALEARRLTVLPLVGRPAIETFLLACGAMVGSTAAAIGLCDIAKVTSHGLQGIDLKKRIEAETNPGRAEEKEKSRGDAKIKFSAEGTGGEI